MRILLVSNYAWTVFNFRRRLIRHLEENGHEMFVQTEFDGYESRLGLPLTRVLPLSIDRKGLNPLRDLFTMVSIARGLRRVRADACLLFTIKPVVYGGMAAALLGRPHISNITGLGTAFLGPAWVRTIAESLFRVSLRRAAHVFFQNVEDRALFLERRLVTASTTSVLPGSGIDLSRFTASTRRAGSEFVFLMISRVTRDKGVVEYAEAAKLVKKAIPNARFQLLGPLNVVNRTAIAREDVQTWVDGGTLEYLGETDDVRPFVEAADCIVLPSYREGMPRTLLEAAAMARPAVATDVPGCRQVIEDGKTGFLCRARDAQDLAFKMEVIARLPLAERLKMGEAARRKIEHDFDERIVLGHYQLVLEKLLATKAPSSVETRFS